MIFLLQDMAEYQMSLSREIEDRLNSKLDKLGDAFVMDDIGMPQELHDAQMYIMFILRISSMTLMYCMYFVIQLPVRSLWSNPFPVRVP